MKELASCSIWAVEIFVESLALLCLVVFVHVCSLFEFVHAMGKRTSVPILTGSIQLPKLANLSFEFQFETFSGLAICIPVLLGDLLCRRLHHWNCTFLRLRFILCLALVLLGGFLSLLCLLG